jgi:hypothetical protein
MAGTGVSAPSYRLSNYTQKAVKEAGVDIQNEKSGKSARQHLINAGMADELEKTQVKIKDDIVAKQEAKELAREAWTGGFDIMDERGAWASGELFDQFQGIESDYKEEYLAAVKKGDKKTMGKLMKDQAARGQGLQGWKGTMETANKINNGVGWSEAMKNDPEGLEIMTALTTLDGESAKARFDDNGQMVFDISMNDGSTRTVTRGEIDKMVAKGVKPVAQEMAFMEKLNASRNDGAAGTPWKGDANTKRLNALKLTNDSLPALMSEDMGGGGSFSEHIKSHPDMINAFGEFEYTTEVTAEDGDSMVSPTNPASPGGVKVTPEEAKNFNEDDLKLIIDALENDLDTAKPYVAEWQMLQEKREWEEGNYSYLETQHMKDLRGYKQGSFEQREYIYSQNLAKNTRDGARARATMSDDEYAAWFMANPVPDRPVEPEETGQ